MPDRQADTLRVARRVVLQTLRDPRSLVLSLAQTAPVVSATSWFFGIELEGRVVPVSLTTFAQELPSFLTLLGFGEALIVAASSSVRTRD